MWLAYGLSQARRFQGDQTAPSRFAFGCRYIGLNADRRRSIPGARVRPSGCRQRLHRNQRTADSGWLIKRAYQLIDDRDFGRAPAKLECFMTSPRRKLLSERCSGFTPEIAVTFPKRTFFPLEGYGWFLFRSVSYGLEHLPRS